MGGMVAGRGTQGVVDGGERLSHPCGVPFPGLRAGLALAALALLAAGCAGGGGSGVEVETVTPASAETPPPRVGVATETPVVEPPELIVSVGTVVQGSAILVSVTGSVAEGEVVFLGGENAAAGEKCDQIVRVLGADDRHVYRPVH